MIASPSRVARSSECLWLVPCGCAATERGRGTGRDHTLSMYIHVRDDSPQPRDRDTRLERSILRNYADLRPTTVQVRYLYAQSTQYTATRRIKSDYTTVSSELCDDFATRYAMWPSVAGESCESREAWAASLTTSCHLRLPVSRLHHPSHRHAQFQPPTSISARPFDADDLTTARPSDGAQIAPRGAAPREPAVHAWRARVAW